MSQFETFAPQNEVPGPLQQAEAVLADAAAELSADQTINTLALDLEVAKVGGRATEQEISRVALLVSDENLSALAETPSCAESHHTRCTWN